MRESNREAHRWRGTKPRTLPTMSRPEDGDLLAALQALAERERDTRDRLIDARDELNDRDDLYATLEAELWAHVEAHELRTREQVARHVREVDSLRDEAIGLRVRLDRIEMSAPMRLYARFKHLPVLRQIAQRRTREYEAALQTRLRN
jgi:hypothetical protein